MIRLRDLLIERLVFDQEHVDQIAQTMGETVTKALGKGANGVAYELASGRVLKITADRAEVALATRLRVKRLYKHIVNVYDVRRLPQQDAYAIVQDLVEPLSDNHRRIWNQVRYAYLNSWTHPWTDAEFKQKAPQLIAHDFKAQRDDEFIDRITTQRSGVIRDFNELRIVSRETHGANMGWNRHGSLVHFDAWQHEHYSKVPAYIRQAGGEQPRNLNPYARGMGQDINLDIEP